MNNYVIDTNDFSIPVAQVLDNLPDRDDIVKIVVATQMTDGKVRLFSNTNTDRTVEIVDNALENIGVFDDEFELNVYDNDYDEILGDFNPNEEVVEVK